VTVHEQHFQGRQSAFTFRAANAISAFSFTVTLLQLGGNG